VPPRMHIYLNYLFSTLRTLQVSFWRYSATFSQPPPESSHLSYRGTKFPVVRLRKSMHCAIYQRVTTVSTSWLPNLCLLRFCFSAGNNWHSLGEEFPWYNQNQRRLFTYVITGHVNLPDRTFYNSNIGCGLLCSNTRNIQLSDCVDISLTLVYPVPDLICSSWQKSAYEPEASKVERKYVPRSVIKTRRKDSDFLKDITKKK